MSHDTAVATVLEQNCVEKLAQLFPHASPMRMAVRLVTKSVGRRRLQENTVIEFGTPHEVLFSSIFHLSLRIGFAWRTPTVRSSCTQPWLPYGITGDARRWPHVLSAKLTTGSSNRDSDYF